MKKPKLILAWSANWGRGAGTSMGAALHAPCRAPRWRASVATDMNTCPTTASAPSTTQKGHTLVGSRPPLTRRAMSSQMAAVGAGKAAFGMGPCRAYRRNAATDTKTLRSEENGGGGSGEGTKGPQSPHKSTLCAVSAQVAGPRVETTSHVLLHQVEDAPVGMALSRSSPWSRCPTWKMRLSAWPRTAPSETRPARGPS